MNSHTEAAPMAKPPSGKSTWKQRVFAASFLTACTVAMIGWLVTLGWAAIKLAAQLFF